MEQQNTPQIDSHSTAWTIQVWVSWLVAMAMSLGGAMLLPVDWWIKGYLLMGQLFLVGSTFTFSKSTRDNHEAAKLRNRITKAKTDRLLKEFELTDAA
ncbi:MAG: YiaA/YiaB family inner membrane protein [Myxococcota bacterium]